jgi:hypothetical protein
MNNMNMAQRVASRAVAENSNATVNTGINPMADPLGALAQYQAQAPMPTYGAMTQTAPSTGMAINNAVTPEQLAVGQQVNGDQIQNQRSMQGLV